MRNESVTTICRLSRRNYDDNVDFITLTAAFTVAKDVAELCYPDSGLFIEEKNEPFEDVSNGSNDGSSKISSGEG